MAKEKAKNNNDFNVSDAPADTVDPNVSVDRLPVTIHSQFIKDLSFENPLSPTPPQAIEGQPKMNVEFAMDARKVDVPNMENTYEVTLHVEIKAQKGERVTFLIDLQYGLMAEIGPNVPEDKIHPLLLIEMPHYLFPFVRQLVAELTQQAGYSPLLLSPVNFKALYRNRFGGPQVTDHTKKDTANREGDA